jgi:hypothetical protein
MKPMDRWFCAASAAVLMVAVPLAGPAQAAPISLELVLSIDVSGSVSTGEFDLQRNGYVNAFQSAALQNAILGTPGGSIAATFVQWSGATQQQQSVGWTLINSAASANAFASSIAAASRAFSGNTAVAAAITYSAGLFNGNGYEGSRLIIDISGDGTDSTTATRAARDAAVAAGITINGLPIGGASINSFYANNVIGGPGAFFEPANDFGDFASAVQRKLEREVVGVVPVPGALPMMLGGMALFGMLLRRRVSA